MKISLQFLYKSRSYTPITFGWNIVWNGYKLTLFGGDLYVGSPPRDMVLDVVETGGVRSLEMAPIGESKLRIGILARGLSR